MEERSFDLFWGLALLAVALLWGLAQYYNDQVYLQKVAQILGMEVHALTYDEEQMMPRGRYTSNMLPNFKVRNLNTGNFHYVRVLGPNQGFIYQDTEFPTLASLKARLEPEVALCKSDEWQLLA